MEKRSSESYPCSDPMDGQEERKRKLKRRR
jgi:hypothetical protein